MYDHLNIHAVRAEHEIAIAEANLILANMPDRELRPGRVSRAKAWVAEHRRDRRFAVARQNFVSPQASTRDV